MNRFRISKIELFDIQYIHEFLNYIDLLQNRYLFHMPIEYMVLMLQDPASDVEDYLAINHICLI